MRVNQKKMKWLIASDIHGSWYYTKKLLEAFTREEADRLLILGDILYHGPRNDLPREYNPKKVIIELNKVKEHILAIRGNCDTEVDQMVLEFPIMAEYCVIPVCRNTGETRVIYATHGHNYNPNQLPPLQNKDILLNGHTHVPACIDYDKYTYMNPGSISIPKEKSVNSYMILEDGVCTWKDMEGNAYMEYNL